MVKYKICRYESNPSKFTKATQKNNWTIYQVLDTSYHTS